MNYSIKRSSRKSIGIEVRPSGEVLVRAPYHATIAEIEGLLEKHRDWVQRAVEKMHAREAAAENVGALTAAELHALADEALRVIPERVKYYAPIVGVSVTRISIRNQRTRWGSCSADGHLSFNCLLMLAPPEVLDSVVVHELCHRKHMNHSAAFYDEVLRVMPDYHVRNRWLKENGPALIRRMTMPRD